MEKTIVTRNPETLSRRLNEREEQGSLRELLCLPGTTDFSSNDYLGFARSPELSTLIEEKCRKLCVTHGSTGSRLLSGNSSMAEELEGRIASCHRAEAALLFNSGYDANIGLFSSVPQAGDTILYDKLMHASVRDGLRLTRAQSIGFRHNDVDHLRHCLTRSSGTVYVVVESVYSMDGDFAPLREISDLCYSSGAHLIVDEAHATGVYGKKGEGRVVEEGLEERVFARLHTFGKALGCHGAAVVGSSLLRTYLINFARSFIYTTALPAHSLAAIDSAYDLLNGAMLHRQQELLFQRISQFREAKKLRSTLYLNSPSPIQGVLVPGNEKARAVATQLQRQRLDVRAVLSPTVPRGEERLRISLHSFNCVEDVSKLVCALEEHLT